MALDKWVRRIAICLTAGTIATLTYSTEAAAQSSAVQACDVVVQSVWLSEFTITASTQGECGSNDLHLNIQNAAGTQIWADHHAPSDLFDFEGITSPEDMRSALKNWITFDDTTSTAMLPPWHPDQAEPEFSDFPFFAAEGVSRSFYTMARALDLPMACYIQGLESTFCLFQMPDEALLEPIGYQSFPG